MYTRSKGQNSEAVPPPSYGGTLLSGVLPVLDDAEPSQKNPPKSEVKQNAENKISPSGILSQIPLEDIIVFVLLIILSEGKNNGGLPLIGAVLAMILL